MDVIKLIKHTGIKGIIVSKNKSGAKVKELFMLVSQFLKRTWLNLRQTQLNIILWMNWLILSDMEWDTVRET